MARQLKLMLDRVSMYRLMLYFLIGLVLIAATFSALGLLAYRPLDILAGAAYLCLACYVANQAFARLFRVQPNVESQFITALILALVVGPGPFLGSLWLLTLVSLLAMASKYALAYRGRHLFNPAAAAVLLAAHASGEGASWWVSGRLLLPFVLLGGLLVARKMRRFHLVLAFLLAYFALLLATHVLRGAPIGRLPLLLREAALSSPLAFFAFVMLAEPQTSPPTMRLRVLYGAAIAGLYIGCLRLFPAYPYGLELALLSGNLIFYPSRMQSRLRLSFLRREKLGDSLYSLWFEPGRPLSFRPGQYLEWTVAHRRADSGGVRRFFTVASSPTEGQVLLATRAGAQPSSFKRALLGLRPGEEVMAVGPSGDFTLPADASKPLVFVAGGIGITPFRSMVEYLLDKGQPRRITLLYAAHGADDFAFRDVFAEGERRLGLKVVYAVTGGQAPEDWQGRRGPIAPDMIRQEVPDYLERLFYVSGPEPMVDATAKMLSGMGVKSANIKRDYFPGYGDRLGT